MDKAEAKKLVERCLPSFAKAGLKPLSTPADIVDVTARAIASLWAGMGNVYKLTVKSAAGESISIIAKRVDLPDVCDSIGDQRKKDSYDVEAAFYSKGHAERLIQGGALVPHPLYVDKRGGNVTICMTEVEGRSSARGDSEAFVSWLAKLHATYWGSKRADEAVASGLQAQGCYWHLDTRPDEHARMGTSGFMGRLKLAARAIDMRLKADPLQSVVHGDAKGANIVYAEGPGGTCTAVAYDFQYCGKACAAKDLAYFFNVDAPSSQEEPLLKHYHAQLSALLTAQGDAPPTLEDVRTAHELALADWRRFSEIGLGGWGDGNANRRVTALLDKLDGGKALGSEQAYIDAMQKAYPVAKQ